VNFWKVILATLVIFGAGLVTGGLIMTYSDFANRQHHESSPRVAVSTPPAAQRPNRLPIPYSFLVRTNFIEQLDHELKLTAIQREHIEKIVHEGQEQIKGQCHATLVETRERISEELTPEQQTLYEELLRRKPNAPKAITNSAALKFSTNSPPNR
jgi:hypothetical protein